MAEPDTPPDFVPDFLKELAPPLPETLGADGTPLVSGAAKHPIRRHEGDILGLAWFHGAFHAAAFRRQKMLGNWSSSTPVKTMEELAAALDEALEKLEFIGLEVFLVLEHEQFIHQTESAPAFSDAAARAYLQSRIARFQQDDARVLWVAQRTLAIKKDASFILHILPSAFYDSVNQLLRVRRLDLTRILPLAVPLQRELDKFPIEKDTPVLLAAEAGEATVLMVARVNGPLLFSRTILASWSGDTTKIGMEVNRSLLYAKQQFSANVVRIWALATTQKPTAEIKAKCGADKQIVVLPTSAVDLLLTVAKLSPRHPVNLVANYLRKKRRLRSLRTVLMAACWLGFVLLAFNSWLTEKSWRYQQHRFVALRASEASLRADQVHLAERNRAFAHERTFVEQAADERMPPVGGRFLAYLASVLPVEIRLTDFSVRHDTLTQAWSFRLDGICEGDDESSRETVGRLQKLLVKGPFRAHYSDASRTIAMAPISSPGQAIDSQRFSVEGGLLEK